MRRPDPDLPVWAALLVVSAAHGQPSSDAARDETLVVVGARAAALTDAEAVDVIDTQLARSEAVDMGAVLDRTQGVTLRRSGGLGAPTTFSLHGLSGRRIRVFVDGVPAEATGLNISPADLPVHLIERVEIYKGVVPIRLGADALGGAVNFVTRDAGLTDAIETTAQFGSYGVFRGSAVSRAVLAPELGLVVDVDAFFDRADNDYPVEVQIPDARGRPSTETVPRFHDGYQAHGLSARVGVLKRPWADRLMLGAFVNRTEKDLQHNLSMATPYGDITLGDSARGLNLHYRRRDRLSRPLGVELLLSYADTTNHFDDVSRNQWNWRGEVVRARPNPGERTRGERVTGAGDRAAGRLNVAWRADVNHRFEVSATPDARREARRIDSTSDADLPTRTEDYSLFKLVSGASWQLQLFGARVENDLFVKHYLLRAEGPPRAGSVDSAQGGGARQDFGFGDGLRVELLPGLHAKASYELAVRLPDPRELFGDGGLLDPAPGLRNESSHNANLGLVLEPTETPWGRFDASVHGFLRDTHDLIFLVTVLDTARYQNVADVRTLGAEASVGWTGWRTLTLTANGTWLNAVNSASDGPFGHFEGDRIPNLPYRYGNLSAAVARPLPWAHLDQARLYWYGRYVHEYFLFWESQGDPATKLKVPTQLTHTLGLSLAARHFTLSAQVDNLTDEARFDNVGVQLAGRTFQLKLGASL